MADEPDAVPKYFSDFMVEFGRFREENQRQHGELAERIAQVEARLAWRMMAGGVGSIGAIILAIRFLTPTS